MKLKIFLINNQDSGQQRDQVLCCISEFGIDHIILLYLNDKAQYEAMEKPMQLKKS